jgi:hypothetical protein
MNKIILLACFLWAGTCLTARAQKTAYTLPEVNKILKKIHLYIDVELDDSTKKKAGLSNSLYLLPLTNYIDYNVIGKGAIAVINEDGLRDYVLKAVREGKTAVKIGKGLINEYNRLRYVSTEQGETEDVFHLGGFFAGEVEQHQEENGEFATKLEVNQLKLYFASHLNAPSGKNNVSFFAEFNPVPEEVVHQITAAVIKKGLLRDTLREYEVQGDNDDKIPFERLFVSVNNIGGSKLSFTLGQFRNPFGIWSDYTTHRNFSNTKNNTLVNGFALKKIELGVMAGYQLTSNLNLEAAVVYGRSGRTAPLYRDDVDNKKDLVTHLTYSNNRFTAGASAYLAEFAFDKRNAYGIDLGYRFDKLLLSGEYVVQRCRQLTSHALNIAPLTSELSSNAAYLQFDYEITNKLHLFGMYDYWKLNAGGETVNKPAFKIFHGLKYSINPKARWTVLEYGHMLQKSFNRNFTHISTYLEINF